MQIPKVRQSLSRVAALLNYLSASAVAAMMILTTADVILRFFRCPIPGTYEIVGFLGAIVVAFALASTSMNRGHIAVDFLVAKLPEKAARWIERGNVFICTGMFFILTWYLFRYAADIRKAGEVSMTLQMPIFPFIYGVGAGCAVLCLVFVVQIIDSFVTNTRSKKEEQA
ncbi:MAG: TRAP transporter small permease [Thermodesulfobacteriota bacterium]|nr:TRAP transporter small permease [Thermodesulfobacteriota bacterium]